MTEPTQEMIEAAAEAIHLCDSDDSDPDFRSWRDETHLGVKMSDLSDWKKYVHEPIVQEFTKRLAEAADAIERKDAEIERLNDDYLRRHKDACDRWEEIGRLNALLTKQGEEIERLRNEIAAFKKPVKTTGDLRHPPIP